MDILIVSLVALLASVLTLFSGFGLGTLLMPVVAVFFPLDVAIAITAIVHLSNNCFKVALVGKGAHLNTLLKFGLPAMLFAFIGAILLTYLSHLSTVFQYSLFSFKFTTTLLNFCIGVLILLFVFIELSPTVSKISINKKHLPLGGALSGFLGGLSGHQGAFRSLFLLKVGLDKTQFIATGVVIAVMVDLARLTVYGWNYSTTTSSIDWLMVTFATLSAFLGAYIGKKFIKKVTITFISRMVALLLIIIGLSLMTGLI
jgi:uncharacterized membrane protein YfcA